MALVLQQLQQQQQQVVLGEVCQLVAGGRCEGQAQQFCMMVTSTQCCDKITQSMWCGIGRAAMAQPTSWCCCQMASLVLL